MPSYFPDLKSVKQIAERMQGHAGDKKYKGIVPQTEDELSKGRIELGKYMRETWNDNLIALEIELAVTKNNYHQKLRRHMRNNFFK